MRSDFGSNRCILRPRLVQFFLKGRTDMSKTRSQKEAVVSDLTDKFKRMKSAAFVSVAGYTMKDADGMRAKGKEAGVDVLVTKKTFLKIAAEQAGVSGFDPKSFDGSVLTAFSFNDEVAGAKLLAGLLKERDQMKFLGGILEGAVVDATKVKVLAKLPSKKELLAKMVGSLNAPVSGFVNVLAGNLRGLVTVLGAIKDKKPA